MRYPLLKGATSYERIESTFMRKGYWLTALAAAVLLAASPGTAQAQVTVTAPDEVVEGERATIYGDRQGDDHPAHKRRRSPSARRLTVTATCLRQTLDPGGEDTE